MQIKDIFSQLMDADKIVGDNVSELSRRTNIPQPTLRNILIGTTTTPRPQTINTLAQYYGISTAQFNGHVPIDYDKVKRQLLPSAPVPASEIDAELLSGIIQEVETWLETNCATLPPKKKAKIIQLLYSHCINQTEQCVDHSQVTSLMSLAI